MNAKKISREPVASAQYNLGVLRSTRSLPWTMVGLNKLTRTVAVGLLVVGSVFTTSPAFAQGGNFIKIESHHAFAPTVRSLKEAVASNHMMVMGNINQSKVLSMTGLRLEGEAFLVGNPVMGKKAFSMDPAAGAVLPARIYVWSQDGQTYIGYFKPSSLLTQISPSFSQVGGMLDQKFDMIAKNAAE